MMLGQLVINMQRNEFDPSLKAHVNISTMDQVPKYKN